MTAEERIESILLIFLALIVMTAWYNYWVMPRDEIRFAIMDCMGSDPSRAAFDRCHAVVTNSR